MAFHGSAANINLQKSNQSVGWAGIKPSLEEAVVNQGPYSKAVRIDSVGGLWVEIDENGVAVHPEKTDANGNYTPDFRVTGIINDTANPGLLYVDVPDGENIMVYMLNGYNLPAHITRVRAAGAAMDHILLLA